jgi:hypothetical protein
MTDEQIFKAVGEVNLLAAQHKPWSECTAPLRALFAVSAEQIYSELKGVAVTRTSPENICDVLAVIKRLQAAPKGDGND